MEPDEIYFRSENGKSKKTKKRRTALGYAGMDRRANITLKQIAGKRLTYRRIDRQQEALV